MRIVLIGVPHWRTPFYSDPVLGMKDATIVGVSDLDVGRSAPLAAQAKRPVFADYREMCAKLRPDFAFALGRHRDMAEEGRFLIESCIPFAMEKPCALNAAEAQDIASRAAAARVFAAVPLMMRYCPLIETIREGAAGERIQYLSFKFVGGMVDAGDEADERVLSTRSSPVTRCAGRATASRRSRTSRTTPPPSR
jgi:predicted dehydrogenase